MDSSQGTASQTLVLLRRARAGDDSALGRLLERHRPYLRLLSDRYLVGGLKARLGSSDIVQQTCLSAFKKIHDFDSDDPEGFLAWLRAIHVQNVKNVVRDHLAVAKRSLTREENLAATLIVEDRSPSISPSQRLLQNEMAVELAEALEGLSDPQRDAIRLRFLEGLPLKDVAAQMERSEPTVVGLIHRGLLRLKEILPAHTAEFLT